MRIKYLSEFPPKNMRTRLSVPTLCQLCLQTQFANCTAWQGVGGPNLESPSFCAPHLGLPSLYLFPHLASIIWPPTSLPAVEPICKLHEGWGDAPHLLGFCSGNSLSFFGGGGGNKCQPERYQKASASGFSNLLFDFKRFFNRYPHYERILWPTILTHFVFCTSRNV